MLTHLGKSLKFAASLISEIYRVTRSRRLVKSIPPSVWKTLKVNGIDILCNPSIVRHQDRWLIAARTHNYKFGDNGGYIVDGGLKNLTSRTVLLHLDDNLNYLSTAFLEVNLLGESRASNGLEDPRLITMGSRVFGFWSANSLSLTGAHLSATAKPGAESSIEEFPDWSTARSTVCYSEIDIDGNRVKELYFLDSPFGRPREKNWMPFASSPSLSVIYTIDNLNVYSINRSELEEIHRANESLKLLRGWSGSSQIVREGDSWLCVIHFAHRKLKFLWNFLGPFYTHRIVRFSDDFLVTEISDEFFFEHKGIEFCSGLAILDGYAYFTYGLRDNESKLLSVPLIDLKGLLKPIWES